jgi:hypothetical protein
MASALPATSTHFNLIKTGVSAATKRCYHSAACKLSSCFKRIDKSYHSKCANYHEQKGWNAYYELVGSKHKCRAIKPLSSYWIIKAQNQIIPELDNEIGHKQIADSANRALKQNPQLIPSYLTFNSKQSQEHLSKGICQGMVQVFIHEYHDALNQGFPFIEAAKKAATIFKNGAPLNACVMQHLHNACKLNWEQFKKTVEELYTTDERNFLGYSSNVCLGYSLLGAKDPELNIVNISHFQDFIEKSNGAYDVSIGLKIISDEKGVEQSHYEKGHSTALLVHKKSYLIFDPIIGLFPCLDPARYFEYINEGLPGNGTAILRCHQIQY